MSENLISKSELKKTRGWTDSLIKHFLNEPDKISPNPHYKKAAPMKLWFEKKIQDIEKTEEFEKMKTKSQLHKMGSAKAIKTKLEKIKSYIEGVQIELPIFSNEELIDRACNHYNTRNQFSEKFKDTATGNSDSVFLERISSNYLRHCCTNYEEEIDRIFGKTGKNEAYKILRRKVEATIIDKYPHLKISINSQVQRHNFINGE